MLVSWSCDVFIRPGQLGFLLANKIVVPLRTQKNKPNPKHLWRYGHFRPIYEAVFWKLTIFGIGKKKSTKPYHNLNIANTILYYSPEPLYCSIWNYYWTVRSVPGTDSCTATALYYCTTAVLFCTLCTTVLNCTDLLVLSCTRYCATAVCSTILFCSALMYFSTLLWCTVRYGAVLYWTIVLCDLITVL